MTRLFRLERSSTRGNDCDIERKHAGSDSTHVSTASLISCLQMPVALPLDTVGSPVSDLVFGYDGNML